MWPANTGPILSSSRLVLDIVGLTSLYCQAITWLDDLDIMYHQAEELSVEGFSGTQCVNCSYK